MPDFTSKIASCNYDNFNEIALEIFQFQAKNCTILKEYLKNINCKAESVTSIEKLVYLPISFFKKHTVSSLQKQPKHFFQSSGTGGQRSKHYLNNFEGYESSFIHHFNHHFKDFNNFCHLALLPNYIEQGNSSLIYQVNHFVSKSSKGEGAFYLKNLSLLKNRLILHKTQNIPTVLWGVSYALLDFIETFQLDYDNLIIIETGGMKGRRKEMIRADLHQLLQNAFPSSTISSEYGMTELFSQAYWQSGQKHFTTAPSFQIKIRNVYDPFELLGHNRHGAINAIDLNNWKSCSFIETADLGITFPNGGFNVLGRMDQAEIRGCSLLYTE